MNHNQSQSILHANIQGFWDSFFAKNGSKMQCKQGCAACCHVDLGVFLSEAAIIVEWFSKLDKDKQKSLRTAWNTSYPAQANANGKVQNACAFLSANCCSIYEVRPTICRTQGLPLMFKEENLKTKETILHVDVCPLNFTAEDSLPPQTEWLDLDRLNALQSIAARQFSGPASKQYEPLMDQNQRIPLRNLRDHLAHG